LEEVVNSNEENASQIFVHVFKYLFSAKKTCTPYNINMYK